MSVTVLRPAFIRSVTNSRDCFAGNTAAPEALLQRPPPLGHQGWEQGGVTMQHELHWLDYDPVAVAVLAIGMGLIELFALLF